MADSTIREARTPPVSPDPGEAALVVGAMTAVQALGSMTNLWFPAVAPKLAGELALPTSLIGYQITILYIFAMLTSLVGGALVTRFGACRTSQAALGFCVLGALIALAPSLATLALATACIGVAYGMMNPPAAHLIAKVATPANRNLIFSLKQTGVPLGGILAGLLAPWAALTLGWQGAMLLVAGLCAALALALQPARAAWDDDRRPTARIARAPFADMALVWRVPALRWLALAALCFAGIQLCLTTFLVTLLVSDLGYALVAAGAVLSAVQACGVAGRLGWGWLADRVRNGAGVLLAIGALKTVGALLIMTLGPDWPGALVVALFAAFGLAAVGWNGVFMAEVARAAPAGRVSAATGGALFFTFMGVLAGPTAFVTAHALAGSYAGAFALVAALSIAGTALVWLARRAGGVVASGV